MLALLNHWVSVVGNFSGSELLGSIAVISEILMRAAPTSKPVSLLQPIGAALTSFSALIAELTTVWNKVVPPAAS